MSVPRLRGVGSVPSVPVLCRLNADDARLHVAAVTAAAVHGELDDEYRTRDDRKAYREHRLRAGKPMQCGGCYWILRNAAQPCPRCGFTNGYGYAR